MAGAVLEGAARGDRRLVLDALEERVLGGGLGGGAGVLEVALTQPEPRLAAARGWCRSGCSGAAPRRPGGRRCRRAGKRPPARRRRRAASAGTWSAATRYESAAARNSLNAAASSTDRASPGSSAPPPAAPAPLGVDVAAQQRRPADHRHAWYRSSVCSTRSNFDASRYLCTASSSRSRTRSRSTSVFFQSAGAETPASARLSGSKAFSRSSAVPCSSASASARAAATASSPLPALTHSFQWATASSGWCRFARQMPRWYRAGPRSAVASGFSANITRHCSAAFSHWLSAW